MAERKLDNMGLYQSDYEHDACGVGMVVNIHGGKSHDLVDNALKVLENMEHRGAETRDKTGEDWRRSRYHGTDSARVYPVAGYSCA